MSPASFFPSRLEEMFVSSTNSFIKGTERLSRIRAVHLLAVVDQKSEWLLGNGNILKHGST